MAVYDLKDAATALRLKRRFKEIGYSVNIEHHRAYRYLAKSIRDQAAEKIFKEANYEILEVPCGYCIGCRLDYSKNWASRCVNESSKWQFNWFITLTYDDLYLVYSIKGHQPTIVPEHVDKFIKALRNYFKVNYDHDGIRYLYCTEYGDQFMRPHVHLMLFNCPIPDLTPNFKDGDHIFQKKDAYGVNMYFSQIIYNAWSKGFITIQDANFHTAAYVASYVVKAQKGENAKTYEVLGIKSPYLRMSNRPGIGYEYLKDNLDHLKEFPMVFVGRPHKPPLQTAMPRYYRKKITEEMTVDEYDRYYQDNIKYADHKRSLLSFFGSINNQRVNAEFNQINFQKIKDRGKTENNL